MFECVFSNLSAEGAGNPCERVLRTIQRVRVGVAVDDWQGGFTAVDRVGHRKRGCKATSSPSFSATTKSTPIGVLFLLTYTSTRASICAKQAFYQTGGRSERQREEEQQQTDKYGTDNAGSRETHRQQDE